MYIAYSSFYIQLRNFFSQAIQTKHIFLSSIAWYDDNVDDVDVDDVDDDVAMELFIP